MIRKINTALLEMQGALLARSLYPAGSKRVSVTEQRAWDQWNEILRDRKEVTLFVVEGRVICDNEILPSSATLADSLFHMLQNRGIDQVTVHRGLTLEEIKGLLDRLSDLEGRSDVDATDHLRFGSLSAVEREAPSPGARTKTEAELYASEAAEVLPGIWEDLSASHSLQAGQLGDIVSCLCRTVASSASALIPLAPLKRHDEYTFVHTINVAILSISLGEAVGLSDNAVYELSVGALLHDVGKQAVPKKILNKHGLFTPEERQVMEIHPIEGARMLINTPNVPEIAAIVAYEHHVRADGGGYPRVPNHWRLSLASRIVQLADVFDALRTNRPYRPGLPLPKIVELMKAEVGSFFDADLVKVFFEQVVSRGIPSPANVA
ncbi:MAG: HD domain-containing protein [Acidobacteria bacterium]|nr:HD domain-containing protein [Acidobacteriota bacterium]NIM60758.1 HD domain-containing protein [Acidobacteriota bacterium]NIO57971.1 HD domain-containing protein [Acidobacteriota bacterium]NIQ28976.1 HD domain-containing protein [Acidobacteriota bacterium]NIQ83448.1 HD domain-containing protein [Acidobacteriota bacterium]